MSLSAAEVDTPGLFEGYELGNFYDEMSSAPGAPRPHYDKLFRRLATTASGQLEERRRCVEFTKARQASDYPWTSVYALPWTAMGTSNCRKPRPSRQS